MKLINRYSILFCLLAFSSINVFSQNIFLQDSVKKSIRAIKANSKINIDGRLTEPDWQYAQTVTDFTQIEPQQGRRAFFKTVVKSLYNEKGLYFGFICYDTVGANKYKVPDLKRDFPFWKHDLAGITIDGFNDKRNSISFFANPYGAQRDYQAFDDTYFDVNWNGLWIVRTTRTDSCWIAEFEIPWKTIRFKISSDSSFHFGINFQRNERTSNEKSAWSPYPRSVGFDRVEYAGLLTGFKPLTSSTNVQLNIFSLLNNEYAKGADAANYNNLKPKIGGDIKWAITPNLVLDATVNTDFAQADADNLVNNLSRFSIFFPEKRQFFLENASLFGIGITPNDNGSSPNLLLQPFFSRRIGLDKNINLIPIDAGTRLVYRSLKRSIGLLAVRQRTTEQSPLQHFFVTRYTENIGKANRVGIIVSGKVRGADSAASPYTNLTAGIDGFFRLSKLQSMNFMFLHAGNLNKTKGGFGGYIQYQYNSNNINLWWTQAMIQNDFNPETGFVSRLDVITTAPGFQLNIRKSWLPFKKVIRDYAPGINAEWYHQASRGKLSERVIKITPLYFDFIKGGLLSYNFSLNYQQLFSAFEPLGIEINPGKYYFTRHTIFTESNPSKKIAYSLNYEWGKYFNGKLQSTNATIIIAPIPFVSVNLSINHNEFHKVGKDSVNKTVNLFAMESRLALNPRVQLILLYQKNSLNKQDAYNIRFSWEYKPLSYIYLVFNSRAYTIMSRQIEKNTIFKASYLKQF